MRYRDSRWFRGWSDFGHAVASETRGPWASCTGPLLVTVLRSACGGESSRCRRRKDSCTPTARSCCSRNGGVVPPGIRTSSPRGARAAARSPAMPATRACAEPSWLSSERVRPSERSPSRWGSWPIGPPSATAVGLVGLLRMVPSAVVAPRASPLADRGRRERVLVLVSTVRGVATRPGRDCRWIGRSTADGLPAGGGVDHCGLPLPPGAFGAAVLAMPHRVRAPNSFGLCGGLGTLVACAFALATAGGRPDGRPSLMPLT